MWGGVVDGKDDTTAQPETKKTGLLEVVRSSVTVDAHALNVVDPEVLRLFEATTGKINLTCVS